MRPVSAVSVACLATVMLMMATVIEPVAAQSPSADAEATRMDHVHAYVRRTREWGPADYQVEAQPSRDGAAHLPAYRVTPSARLRRQSHTARTFEIFLDQRTGDVVGERTPRVQETRTPDGSRP